MEQENQGRAAFILAVEDEAAVRSAMVAYLEDRDYRVAGVGSGREALQLCARELPDLVLCDLRMPGMDGLELLSELQGMAPELPVIIVSGVNRMEDAIQALKRGAWDYVTKPILDMEILDRAVRRALERVRLQRENRAHLERQEQLNRRLSAALERLRQDEQAARTLQASLLPPSPARLGPWRFRRRIFTSLYLSGDFVDWFPLGRDRTGFYMADVSGHGTASALVTVMLKTLFERYHQSPGAGEEGLLCSPAATLATLNRDLCRLLDDKYLTIFYGVLDARDDRLIYASGGQFPYPLQAEGERLIRRLDDHDQPVGLFDDAGYREFTVALGRTARLLMVSDGILELLTGDGRESRMEQLIGRLEQAGFDCDRLIGMLQLEQREELPDDIAFLTLQREPGDA